MFGDFLSYFFFEIRWFWHKTGRGILFALLILNIISN